MEPREFPFRLQNVRFSGRLRKNKKLTNDAKRKKKRGRNGDEPFRTPEIGQIRITSKDA